MTKRFLALSLLLALFTGCVTNSVTQLTPTTQPRNPTGQYRVEFQFDSTQQTVRWDTIKPHTIVDLDTYEMKQVLRTTNRWEAFIPIPASKNQVIYQFKVDYEVTQFGKPLLTSKLSPLYKLVIK
jgi:hypothetical protein